MVNLCTIRQTKTNVTSQINKQANMENFRVPANSYCIGLIVSINRSTVTVTNVRSDAIHEACSSTAAIISKEDFLDNDEDDSLCDNTGDSLSDSPGVFTAAVVDELSVVAIMTKIIITRPTNASVIDKFKIRMVEPMADR